jgi:hypothetical protein
VLAAAVVVAQFYFTSGAQASAIQAAELSSTTRDLHVGFYPIDAHRVAPAPPLMASLGSSVAYGRMVSDAYGESPRSASALSAYYPAQSWQHDNHWQFEERSRNWQYRSGRWHGFDDGHHGFDYDQDGVGQHPPAVPIPAAAWLFASGGMLLAWMSRVDQDRELSGATAFAPRVVAR